MIEYIINAIKNKCSGCARLQDAKAEQSVLRMEKSRVVMDYQILQDKYQSISETNAQLGKELERKANELRAAEMEIAHIRKHLEQMKNALKERNTEYTKVWRRIQVLEEQNAKLMQENQLLLKETSYDG